MNRLWVRLSAMICGVLFLVFFLQFLSIMLDRDVPAEVSTNAPANRASPYDPVDRLDAPHEEIARRLIDFGLFSLLVGLLGGVMISLVVTRPVNRLTQAAARMGSGELAVRVPVAGPREIQDLARKFNEMAATQAQSELLRKNMLADISHELRTPLTVLNATLRAALDGVYKMDEAEVARLVQQTAWLIHLVNDLRDLSLAEAGKLPLAKELLDLSLLADDCMLTMEPLAADREIQLVSDLPGPLMVEADPLRIRQILFNLLANAIRHSERGGTVRLTGRQTAVIEVSVIDTGEGMSEDQLTHLFNRFYRADTSRSRESGGSGLGLSIARTLAHIHGGDVLAESGGPGKGSTFTLRLKPVTGTGP